MKAFASDELLKNQICEALEQFDEEDYSHLQVDVKEQNVYVRGSVSSEAARQSGKELIGKIRGVRRVVDQTKVE